MFFYWLIFLFCCAPLFVSENGKQQRHLTAIIGLVLIIFIGTRERIGLDVRVYDEFFDYVISSSFYDGLQRIELGFSLLSFAVNFIGFGYSGLNFALATFFICGMFFFIDHFKCYKLAWLSFFPVGLIIVGMGFGRQSAAIGCIACMIVFFHNYEFRKAFFAFTVASLLHYGSLVLLPIIFAQVIKVFLVQIANKHHKNIIIFLFAVIVCTLFLLLSPFFKFHIIPRIDYYLSESVASAGFWYRWILIAIPASAILWMVRHDCVKNWLFSINFQFSLSVFLLAPLAVYFSTLADRVLMFFIPIVPLGYFYLFKMFSNFFDRQLTLSFFKIFVFFYFAAAFYVWASFSSFAKYWFPYKSYLFHLS